MRDKSAESIIRAIQARYDQDTDLSISPLSPEMYLPEGSLAVKWDQFIEQLRKNDLDFHASGTATQIEQEPLTLERMMQTIQSIRDQYPEPPVEILSPAEYFRRAGFRLPLSEETLAELEAPAPPTRLKHELIYGNSFMPIKDFYLTYRAGGTGELPLEKAQQMIESLKAQYGTEPAWIISPKTQHQLTRLAARKRRHYRAWLRAKRQRRARQRRHNRGQ